jgi:DNA-3-methyladenine glycosylase I
MSEERCICPGEDSLMIAYHDKEWGTPLHDDKKLFEFFTLSIFQAGLSWKTVLHKRASFRKAFDNYNLKKIANYKQKEINRLLKDAKIIRNQQKITATINNAQKFLEIKKEFGSFDKYIWRFTNNKTIKNEWKEDSQIPARTRESDAVSADLKKRGVKFIGSTICYAFIQSVGIVNDHTITCFRYKSIN